jgi:hypothetical protein
MARGLYRAKRHVKVANYLIDPTLGFVEFTLKPIHVQVEVRAVTAAVPGVPIAFSLIIGGERFEFAATEQWTEYHLRLDRDARVRVVAVAGSIVEAIVWSSRTPGERE